MCGIESMFMQRIQDKCVLERIGNLCLKSRKEVWVAQKEKNRKFQHELESNAREQIARENKISFIHQKLGELLPDPKAEYVEENEDIGLKLEQEPAVHEDEPKNKRARQNSS